MHSYEVVMPMEFTPGQIVKSRQGRDVEHWYVVLGVEGERVLLADGDKRTLESPKKKNLRHIAPTKTVLGPAQTATNLTLKKALKDYANSREAETTGG